MKIEQININLLNPDINNFRRHDSKNIDIIKNSLTEFGQYRPFVVQRDGMIVRVGNGMLEAMKQNGYSGDVSAVILDINEEQAKALGVMDNRSSDLSTFDEYTLTNHLEQLDEIMQHIAGFSSEEIDRLLDIPMPSFRSEANVDPDRPLPATIFRCGPISLLVSRKEYNRWLTELQLEAGFNVSDQIAVLKARLII